MARDAGLPERDTPAGEGDRPDEEPRVLLFVGAGRDRDLLLETLGERYRVEATTDPDALGSDFDCCVLDRDRFARNVETVRTRRAESGEAFLPFVLLVGDDAAGGTDPEVWEYVDDVISLPVKRTELTSRIGNLIERRRTAVELARRTDELERTVKELRLKDRAIDEAPIGFTITDPDREDNPLVYMNERFEETTGYDRSEALGRNCRFLQGEGTDPDTRREIREAIDAEEPVSVDILNYRKNGRKFWNKLDIAPVHGDDGTVTNYVGFQTDITERKIEERRLEVLNRVLSHNLRNKMNVIQGHAALLRDEYGDEDPPDSLTMIESAASDLMGLAEAVRKIERTVSGPGTGGHVVAVDERIEQLTSMFEDRFPEAEFELSLPAEGSCEVTVPGLVTAIEEAVKNAIQHNDAPDPTVEIRVKRRDNGWIEIEIEDNGPGIPDREVAVLGDGETPLHHADRLGLWLIYWVVDKAGGEFDVSDADPRGTVLTLSVPARD